MQLHERCPPPPKGESRDDDRRDGAHRDDHLPRLYMVINVYSHPFYHPPTQLYVFIFLEHRIPRNMWSMCDEMAKHGAKMGIDRLKQGEGERRRPATWGES